MSLHNLIMQLQTCKMSCYGVQLIFFSISSINRGKWFEKGTKTQSKYDDRNRTYQLSIACWTKSHIPRCLYTLALPKSSSILNTSGATFAQFLHPTHKIQMLVRMNHSHQLNAFNKLCQRCRPMQLNSSTNTWSLGLESSKKGFIAVKEYPWISSYTMRCTGSLRTYKHEKYWWSLIKVIDPWYQRSAMCTISENSIENAPHILH